ncbi:MaoC family dehydratase [Streptomyces sp. NBC_01718]|uniref:MaoC family dehydratase n=1 Tax=Streptomyces sp. NBC_01718 TaxID=2975919 RepID=UPI00352FEC48
MRVFKSPAELRDAVGTRLGVSGPHTVGQDRADLFAEATGDHHWIHTDLARAAEGPFGTTIVHGYLTLSLLPVFAEECYRIDSMSMLINYGLNRVRFPAPVPVGTALRATADLTSVEDVPGGVQAVITFTVESGTGSKPHCVAETVVRYFN